MKTYEVDLWELHRVWYRATITIEADSEEEAMDKASDIYRQSADKAWDWHEYDSEWVDSGVDEVREVGP